MNIATLFENTYVTIFEEDISFSKNYIEARSKEKRVLSDEEVLLLPQTKNTNPYKKEWKLRQKSTQRFINYICEKQDITILDIGCGNGWFTNKIASTSKNNKVIGLDVNLIELKQANRIFRRKNLRFVCADIFKRQELLKNNFDIIVLNGTVQYFSNFEKLFKTLKGFLKPNGEIHVIDSPFYKTNEIELAKKRTHNYYVNLGFPEMSAFYFHHSLEHLKNFQWLYTPQKGVLKKFFKDIPFPWVRYIKNENDL